MPRANVGRALLGALLLTQAIATSSVAQGTPRDSVARDTMPRRLHDPLMLPLFAAAAGMLAVAPPLLFAFTPADTIPSDAAPMFAEDHVYLFAGPGVGGDAQDHNLWALTGAVELYRRGFYGEARVERFGLHERALALRTVRGGYFVRARRNALWGITVGARLAGDSGAVHGAELALPVVIGARSGNMRMEPLYVVSSQGVSWNYRFQAELALGESPVVLGFRFTAHTFDPHGSPSNETMTLLVGVRR